MLLGLLIRSWAWWYFDPPVTQDAQIYNLSGSELLSGELISEHGVMPLFAIISGVLNDFTLIRIFNILLSILTVLVVYFMVKRIFEDNFIALTGAVLTTAYPHFITYSITALSETTFISF